MILNFSFIVTCVLSKFFEVMGDHYRSTNNNSFVVSSFPAFSYGTTTPTPPSSFAPQARNYDSTDYAKNSLFYSKGLSNLSKRIKTRMADYEIDDHPHYDYNGLKTHISGIIKPNPYSLHEAIPHGWYGQYGINHHYDRDYGGKEAALKGFGFGVSLGLGLLGLLSSLLKFLLIPLLALGALFSLLLLLTIPIPITTTGKRILGHRVKINRDNIKEVIEEIIKKLPADIHRVPSVVTAKHI